MEDGRQRRDSANIPRKYSESTASDDHIRTSKQFIRLSVWCEIIGRGFGVERLMV